MKTSKPILLSGKPAASGIGLGASRIVKNSKGTVLPSKILPEEVDHHLEKFHNAVIFLKDEYDKIKNVPDNQDVYDIVEAQIQTLEDPEVHSGVIKKIQEEFLTSEYAIFSEFNNYIRLLNAAEAEWANERIVDIVSIRDELIEATKDKKKKLSVEKGDIVFADDISPTLMVTLSHLDIGGIVIKKGGLTSHVVILCQSLGIPCVINAKWDRFKLLPDTHVIIDGSTGHVILNPDWKQKKEYETRKNEEAIRLEKRLEWARKPAQTTCGHKFTLKANVEFLEELPKIKSNGAEGVGLLRTETILFETNDFDVESQVNFYSEVVKASGEDPVTIRLFDAGGDKTLEDSEVESNPFLGWRGVRMLLDKKKLLKKQLEAIYRTSGKFSNRIEILIPMVSHIEEVDRVKKICVDVCEKLKKENVPIQENLPIGVMVEVPSVALMADYYATKVDFFSIGTNDLTQYTLAVDRGNEKISAIFDSTQPALWKLIQMTIDAAKNHNIPVSVCGEMASKPESAACLIGMGISELSMNSTSIPNVKHVLCTHSKNDLENLADNVLKSSTSLEVDEYLEYWRYI